MWRLPKLGGCACLIAACSLSGRAEWHVGDTLPPLVGTDSAVAPLPALDGKVVLVDFWASWCAPCKASFPHFASLHQDYRQQGLVIVAVSVDEDAAAYAGFLRRLHPPFLTLRDERQEWVRQAKVPVMPTSYLFGRDGRLRFIHPGFHGKSTVTDLRRQIESLLKETL